MLQTLKLGEDTLQALLWEKFQIINCMISFGSHIYLFYANCVTWIWKLVMDLWCRPKSLYTMLKTHIRNQIVHKAIDLISFQKCRPWSDDVSEARQLVWVYTLCICPKVPLHMMPAILSLCGGLSEFNEWMGLAHIKQEHFRNRSSVKVVRMWLYSL